MTVLEQAALEYRMIKLNEMLAGNSFSICTVRSTREATVGDGGRENKDMQELSKYHCMDMEAFKDVMDELRATVYRAAGIKSC